MRPEEMCRECGNPTGRAGAGEDSLYLGPDEGFTPEVGPLCEECYNEMKPWEPDEFTTPLCDL